MKTACTKLFVLAATLTLFSAGALAQAWPNKAVTIVVPFPPGGPSDIVARPLAKELLKPSVSPSSSTTAWGRGKHRYGFGRQICA